MSRRLRQLLGRLLGGESGSAMTEFVIGLPIFILIFGGMGMLYKMNHEALLVRGEANADMWSNADSSLVQISPVTGGGVSLIGSLDNMGSLGSNATSALGIYVDSYSRVIVPGAIPGIGPRPPARMPSWKIAPITATTDSFANALLNDLVDPTRSSGGFAGAVSSVVQTAGAGPGIAAGIRYGSARGHAERRFEMGRFGEIEYDPGTLHMPAPTAATHRLAAVALTRLTLDTVTPFDKPILEFNTDLDLSGNQQIEESEECGEEFKAYQSCIEEKGEQNPDWSKRKLARKCKKKKPSKNCQEMGGQGPDFDIDWCIGKFGC